MKKLSAVCITYGRPSLLAEALESFLRQDYPGPKEMIILNDLAEQQLEFEHPEVRVINSPVRFRSIGEKRNACAALATGDCLLPWDDDDIHLPNRMSISAAHMERQAFFNPRVAATFINGRIKKPDRNGFPSIACYSREIFDQVRGYSHINSGQDSELEKRIAAEGVSTKTTVIDEKDIFYFYRWSGTNSYHLSAFGQDSKTGKNGMDTCHNCVVQKGMDTGKIVLQPHWKQDYVALVHGPSEEAG